MAQKRVTFTKHAQDRMHDPDRGEVTEEEVLAILANPSVTYTGVDGKPNAIGEVNGKSVRVCFVEEKDHVRVITVINRGNVS